MCCGNVRGGGKTLFFHLIDIAVVNSFILFREHQAEFPDVVQLQRTADYSLSQFREEIVRQICGFAEYMEPPGVPPTRPAGPHDFETVHIPVITEERKHCVVCYKQGLGQKKVQTKCSAEQCKGKYMHITQEKNCFQVFHTREYHNL